MRRRDFIQGIIGARPLAARAQQEERTRRVGVFTALAADEPAFKARFELFHRELERLGWSPARNLRLDYRFGAGQSDRDPVLAAGAVASKVAEMLRNLSIAGARLTMGYQALQRAGKRAWRAAQGMSAALISADVGSTRWKRGIVPPLHE